MPAPQDAQVQKLKEFIGKSNQIVVFTGAGISTESGISDYRSQGGLWDRYKPVTIQEFLADENSRREYWRRKKEMYGQMSGASPNDGHHVIAQLEKQGKLLGVITQNIDGLHKKAGNQKVFEIHGTNLDVICLTCKKVGSAEPVYKQLEAGDEVPLCLDCGGLLKPNTISFGQQLDPAVLEGSIDWARNADLLISAGSTLVVEPAASLPRIAKDNGATLVIVNRDATPLDSMADLVVRTEIGPFLSAAVR
jgi:NAD-dependent deacetylase